METYYLIVHQEDLRRCYGDYDNGRQALSEIERIIREEKRLFIDRSPTRMPANLSHDWSFRVCGAFYAGFKEGFSGIEQCMDETMMHLRKRGFQAEIYFPATLISKYSSLNPPGAK